MALLFRDNGERGGDLVSFFDGSAVKYGLPLPRSRDESYVDYLARLPVDRGVLAEMVRVDGWDGPEMVASVRATRHLKNGQNYCIERFAGPLDTFRSAVAEVLVGLGVASLAVEAFDEFYEPGEHATRRNDVEALVEAARKHDARFFGASFANASHELGCA